MARLESGGFGSSSGSSTSSTQLDGGVGLVQRGGTTTTQEQEQEEDLEEMDTGGLTEDTAGGTPEPTDGADETTTDTDAAQDVEPATARASESVSLGTTGVGTTGTLQSRLRSLTPEAGVGPGFGTDTFGARIGRQTGGPDTIEQAENIGGDATTAADRELQEGEQIERVRSDVEQQLEEQGIDTEQVNIDVQRSVEGFTADVTAAEQEEQFGDFELELGGQTADTRTQIGTRLATNEANPAASKGYTGPVTFEEAVGDLSGDYRQFVDEQFDPQMDTVTGDVVGFFGGEEAGETADTLVQTTAEGALQSVNPFQAALGIKEGVEFGGYTAVETAEGNLGVNINPGAGGEPTATDLLESERQSTVDEDFITTTEEGVAGRAGRAAGAAVGAGVDYATENPVRATGTVGGSLLGSAAFLGAASRVGRGSGLAARYAIQPGEELAGTLGYRATRAASSTRTADRLFPNREPLIFSEEAAIRGGRVASRFTRSKASSGLDVGKSAVARARSRLPDRSDVTPDTSGDSFFIDARTGELVEEGSIRPALYDPEAETNVPDADRPDMIQSLDTEAETERTPGSGAGGGGELSGVVEIDLRKDTGMVETSLLEFEGNARTEAIAETETETRMTPETETRTEVETEQEVRRVQPEAVREAQAAADAMAVELEPMETQFQPERLAQETGIDLELGQETEVAVEQELGFETEQEVEQALEQEFEQETEQETETETEVETRRELEGETLPDEDERRFTEYPKVTEDEFRFASEAATPEEVLEFSFDDSGE